MHISSVTMTSRAGRIKKSSPHHSGRIGGEAHRRGSSEAHDIVNEVLMKEKIKTVSVITCYNIFTAGTYSWRQKFTRLKQG